MMSAANMLGGEYPFVHLLYLHVGSSTLRGNDRCNNQQIDNMLLIVKTYQSNKYNFSYFSIIELYYELLSRTIFTNLLAICESGMIVAFLSLLYVLVKQSKLSACVNGPILLCFSPID